MGSVGQQGTIFTVTVLRANKDDTPRVEYADVVSGNARYRVTPNHDNSLEAVLDTRLAGFLRQRFEKQTASFGMFHEPEAEFKLPTVVLSSLQTIATLTKDGYLRTVFRFSEVVGQVNSVLRASAEGLRSTIQHIAIEAFEHTVREGLALAQTIADIVPTKEMEQHLDKSRLRLDERVNELEFSLNVLCRQIDLVQNTERYQQGLVSHDVRKSFPIPG